MPVNIVVPELGESVVDATVLHWAKQQGERVTAGETVVELETDKVNLEVGAPQAGVLSRIAHKEGEDVKIGDVLGVIDPVGEGEKGGKGAGEQFGVPNSGSEGAARSTEPQEQRSEGEGVKSPAEPQPQSASPASEAPREATQPVKATPVAERMAAELGVDLHQVHPASPDERITKEDVQRAVEQGRREAGELGSKGEGEKEPAPSKAPVLPSAPAPSLPEFGTPNRSLAPQAHEERGARDERVRMSSRRRTIARRLVEVQHTAAILTTFNEFDMTAVMELRRQRKEAFKQRFGTGLGITSFFVKAAVGALKAFPMLNAEVQGDEMVLKHHYDIGIAVGAAEGLVVPVLRDADRMGFVDIERAIGEFAHKAETGTLTIDDLRGGTFTITNGGVFGSLLSTPILNPPQSGILGLHKIEERPVAREGQIVIRPMMYAALSYDHRIVDGREAVQFLVRIKELIEDTATLLLES